MAQYRRTVEIPITDKMPSFNFSVCGWYATCSEGKVTFPIPGDKFAPVARDFGGIHS